MRKALVFLSLACLLFAIEPIDKIELKGSSIDLFVHSGGVISGGDAGVVEFFDSNMKKTKEIALDQVKSAFGEHPPKIYSVALNSSGDLALIREGDALEGRELAIYKKDGTKEVLIKTSQNRMIRKARFVDDSHLFVMEIGGTALLISRDGKILYEKSLLNTSFSDFSLSPDKKEVAIVSESGDVIIASTKDAAISKNLSNIHKDNAYSVCWQSHYIASGSQDRVANLYDTKSDSSFRLDSEFLISSVGLSPDARLFAYVANEAGEVFVVNTQNGNKVATLSGHYAMISNMVFAKTDELITGGDDSFLLRWRIK